MTSTEKPFKWLFVGDLQIPYHDRRAVELFMKVAKAWKPDAIDITGDIDDQLEYSTFSDGTTDEFFNQVTKTQAEIDKVEAQIQRAVEKERAKGATDVVVESPVVPEPIDPMPFIKANAQGAKEFYTDIRAQHKNADIHNSLGNHDIRIFKYMDKKAPDYIDQITPNVLWGLDFFQNQLNQN